MALPKPPPGFKYIFRASVTLKSGKKIYARDYGKRGLPILVKK